jgi:hypothetical protein
MSDIIFYYRSRFWLPQIGFVYCNENGWILPNQEKPVGEIKENYTNEEIMHEVRVYRNTLLSACDWTQLPDVELNQIQVTAWRNYRQELRDFPSKINVTDWTGPDWPTPPA